MTCWGKGIEKTTWEKEIRKEIEKEIGKEIRKKIVKRKGKRHSINMKFLRRGIDSWFSESATQTSILNLKHQN